MKALLTFTLLAFALPCPAAVEYESQIKPIFEARCTKCHGEQKQLGDLALHTEALPVLIEDGLILEGDAENSEVYARLILPEGDKLRMPKGGDPLPREEIELIETWINDGALLTKVESAPAPHEEESQEPKADEPLPAPQPASQGVLTALSATGAVVTPLHAGSPLLTVSFPSGRDQVTDATLDAVAAAGPNVAWLNLGGTSVSDAGVARLAACVNLSRLHLENTRVTDAGVATLVDLNRLEYLNLYGTQVTDAALASLGKLPRLTALYLWKTNVTYDAAKKLMAERNGLDINLGWDHPGVVRDRLTSELARVNKFREEAAEKAKQAEAVLQEAKSQLEAATDRQAQLELELKSLDKPARATKDEQGDKQQKPAK